MQVSREMRYRARIIGTATLAVTHLLLALVAYFGRLNYSVRSATYDQILVFAASEDLWGWLHGLTGLALVAGLVGMLWRGKGARLLFKACSASFAFFIAWGFFNLLWGLTTARPVSLAGPVLALTLVPVGAQILATVWNGSANKGR